MKSRVKLMQKRLIRGQIFEQFLEEGSKKDLGSKKAARKSFEGCGLAIAGLYNESLMTGIPRKIKLINPQ
jgi:hypothetical protein